MSARNVAKRGNHDGDSEAVRESDAEKAEAASAVHVLVRADCSGAEENQRQNVPRNSAINFCDVLYTKILRARS